eukprot:g3085.t1
MLESKSEEKESVEMSQEVAALKIQGLLRKRKARKNIQSLLKLVYEKVYDPDSGSYYYFNTRTGASSWEAPSLLEKGGEILTPEERAVLQYKKDHGTFKTAENMTDEEAAKCIQGLFRSRKAKKLIRELIRGIYEKAVDPNTGETYYYNKKTGESSWYKPRGLGSEDLVLTPRSGAVNDAITTAATEGKEMEPVDVNRMYEEQALKDFLKENGVSQYIDNLFDLGFDDMEALIALEEEDLEELNMKLGHKRKLMAAIKTLRGEASDDDDDEEEEDDEEDEEEDSDAEDEEGKTAEGKENDADEEKEGKEDDSNALVIAEMVDGEIDLNGIDIETLFPGDGDGHPQDGDIVNVHYRAYLLNKKGKKSSKAFEDSRLRGRAFQFELGRSQVISGWEHGIRTLTTGQRVNMTLQPHRAYGEKGQLPIIPPNSTLIFEIELISFAEYGKHYLTTVDTKAG